MPGIGLLIACLTQALCLVHAYPEGSPVGMCADAGFARHGPAPQTSTPPFTITPSAGSYSPGNTMTVTVTGSESFEGFVLLATRATGNIEEALGTFSAASGVKLMTWYAGDSGTESNNCVTQSDDDSRSSLTLTWTAPAVSYGDLMFRGTILTDYDVFWTDVRSSTITALSLDTSVPYNAELQAGTMPTITLDGVCGNSKGCFLFPPGCSDSSCDFAATFNYVAATDSYQFQVLGKADGYVAIGFSTDGDMGDDETIHCIANGNKLALIRGISVGEENWTHMKTGLSDVYVSRQDGYVKCSFVREAQLSVIDPESGSKLLTFDLAKKYYLQVAWGDTWSDSEFPDKHEIMPFTSSAKVDFRSLNKYSADIFSPAIRAHGALGLLSWTVLAGFAMILARHFRQEMKKPLLGMGVWLQLHRAILIAVVVICVISVILVFAYKGEFANAGGVAHAIVGLVATILGVANVVLGFLSPGAAHKRRSIFNWVHRILGIIGWIMAAVTVCLGVSFDYLYTGVRDTLLVIILVWLFLQIFWEILLEILSFCQTKQDRARLASEDPGEKPPSVFGKVKIVCLVLFCLTQLACFISAVYFMSTNNYSL